MPVSERKRAASRANGQKSAGPRTAAGKAVASRNARRHGLSVPVTFEGELPARWEALARDLAAGRPESLPLARAAAECRYNLHRIAQTNRMLLARRIAELQAAEPGASAETHELRAVADLAPQLRKHEKYAREHRSKWRSLARALEA
jgi:hypothetical protein